MASMDPFGIGSEVGVAPTEFRLDGMIRLA
jgi:hypothetical protein